MVRARFMLWGYGYGFGWYSVCLVLLHSSWLGLCSRCMVYVCFLRVRHSAGVCVCVCVFVCWQICLCVSLGNGSL